MNYRSLVSPFKQFPGMSILAVIQAIVLIAVWVLSPNEILPDPLEIVSAWNELALRDGLLHELGKSVWMIWEGIFISAIISFTIAYLSTASFFKPVAGWLTALRFLGFAGITFMFTLWTSSGSELKLWLLVFGMSVFQLTNAKSMVDGITQDQIDYARTLKLSGWTITWNLAIREKLDDTLDIIRQNAAMGWVMLSMVEGLVRSEGGIGDMLLNQNKHLHLAAVFAIQITIFVCGIAQDWMLKQVRSIACPYTKYNSQKA